MPTHSPYHGIVALESIPWRHIRIVKKGLRNHMVRPIEQRLLKISARNILINHSLEPGDEVEIVVRGIVDNVAARPNYNGTVNMIYTVKGEITDRKSTRLNSSHANISYAVFCLKKKNPHCRVQLPG